MARISVRPTELQKKKKITSLSNRCTGAPWDECVMESKLLPPASQLHLLHCPLWCAPVTCWHGAGTTGVCRRAPSHTAFCFAKVSQQLVPCFLKAEGIFCSSWLAFLLLIWWINTEKLWSCKGAKPWNYNLKKLFTLGYQTSSWPGSNLTREKVIYGLPATSSHIYT